MAASAQRRALGVLFTVLAAGFAAIAAGSAWGAGGHVARWVVAAAAAAMAAWLGSLAWTMLRAGRGRA